MARSRRSLRRVRLAKKVRMRPEKGSERVGNLPRTFAVNFIEIFFSLLDVVHEFAAFHCRFRRAVSAPQTTLGGWNALRDSREKHSQK